MSQKLTGEYGIMLYTTDLEALSNWYCTHLGFTLGPHAYSDFVELHINGKNVLHLFKSNTAAPMTRPYFGLNINNAEWLHETLKAAGVQVTDLIRRSDHLEFQLIDLEGNQIYMSQWL